MANSTENQIQQLMRQMGSIRGDSPVFDPVPPSETDVFLDPLPGSPDIVRAHAWMIAHTVRCHSDYAIETQSDGEPSPALTLQHMADDLGWKPKKARKVWREGEALGLFRRDQNYPHRLYLSGDVPRFPQSEKRSRRESPPALSARYVQKQLAALEPAQRAKVMTEIRQTWQWEKQLIREATALVRAAAEQRYQTIFTRQEMI